MRDELSGETVAAIERIVMNLGHAHSSQKLLACPLTLLCPQATRRHSLSGGGMQFRMMGYEKV
jgi:hypothetical protein